MKGMVRATYAMNAAAVGVLSLSRAAGIVGENVQRFAQAAAEAERQRVEFEIAVAEARTMLDAEGYVRLQALTDVAFKYPHPRLFLDAVGTCVVSPQRCQCWWCRVKRFARRCIGRAALIRKKGG